MGTGGRDEIIFALLSSPPLGVKGYIAAIPALLKKQLQEKAYRMYVTDSLKSISENTSRHSGGSYMKSRYYDTVNPKPPETRTPEEIISHMKDKIRKISLAPV